VRFQSVAPREGDALRIDYFRSSSPMGGTRVAQEDRRGSRERGPSFTLLYPNERQYGTAYSPTHDVDVGRDGDRRRVELRGGASDVTVLIPVRRGNAPSISMLPYAGGENDRFALVTLSPPAIGSRRTPRDVTLIMDISGSMSGRKMEQARQSARRLLETLSPEDHFRIVDFATEVRAYPGTMSDRSASAIFASATPAHIRDAQRYIADLDAGGSTNISGALREALRAPTSDGRLSLVLFMTDGEATVGERRADAIADSVRKWRGDRRLFTFGLGSDLNVALLEQLALDGRGTAQFVRPEEDVERAVSLAASRLSTPVVTDVRLRVEGDGVRFNQVLPNEAVDLFAGNDLVFLARYRGVGNARLTITGRTVDGPVSWSTTVNFPERDRENRFVPRLWATRRVGYLSAERRRNGASSEIDAEIRELGERYGIPTEFSSYLVLEPGMVANAPTMQRGRIGDGGTRLNSQVTVGDSRGAATSAAGAPSAEARQQRFEAAKSASAQRATTNLAAMEVAADADATSARRLGGRLLRLENGVWTDGRSTTGKRTLRVKAMSDAWFALVRELPELKEMLSVGERVRIAGRLLVIEVAADGVERLDDGELARASKEWQ
jgi:Ca-activated chloride channel family protein